MTEGERVNYSDSRLECSALSFRLASQSTSLRREAWLYSVQMSFDKVTKRLSHRLRSRALACRNIVGTDLDVTPHPPPKVVPLPPLGKALCYSYRRLTHMWIYHIIIVGERFVCKHSMPSPEGEGGPQSSRRKPWRSMSRLEDGKRWMRCYKRIITSI